MKANIFVNPIEVTNKLESIFGLKKENFMEVVECMVGARNSCTENDPPSAPGWKSWCDGTRRLREEAMQHGWEKNEDGQISSIYDKNRGIKIAVCNTDDGTGLKDRQPQNRSKKGAATDRAVSANQLNFDEKLEGTTNVIQMTPQPGGLVYWYLCVYCEGDVVRAELSCPSSCESGFFRDFSERIILIGGDNDDSGVRLRSEAPNDDSGFEISVVRKKA